MTDHDPRWKSIETIPQTLDKYLVVRTYSVRSNLGGCSRYIEGLHAFNELTSIGTHFYEFWYDLPDHPETLGEKEKRIHDVQRY